MQTKKENFIYLSVCIPTYNNSKKLGELLGGLSTQNLEGVELIVKDDSPSDETEKIVGGYGHLPIRYFHGEKEGFDAAILFLTKKAIGKYIWWFGDDLMEDGTIAKVREIIHEHPNLSFIWLNSRGKLDSTSLAINSQEERFFRDRNEIIELDMGLLASDLTIIKRENILPILDSAEKYKGLSLMTFYLALGGVAAGSEYFFAGHPYLTSDPKPSGEIRWYDQFEVFCINIFKIVRVFEDKFSKKSIRIALRKNLRQCIKAVLVERALGFKTGFGSGSPKAIPMVKLYWNYWEAWAALPFFIMPRWILMTLYPLYKKIKNWPRIKNV